MGMGRIPWTAINAFAETEGVVDRERFRVLIRHLDDQFLTAHHRRTTEAGKAPPKADPPKSPPRTRAR
jgi:hypothetical protein